MPAISRYSKILSAVRRFLEVDVLERLYLMPGISLTMDLVEVVLEGKIEVGSASSSGSSRVYDTNLLVVPSGKRRRLKMVSVNCADPYVEAICMKNTTGDYVDLAWQATPDVILVWEGANPLWMEEGWTLGWKSSAGTSGHTGTICAYYEEYERGS